MAERRRLPPQIRRVELAQCAGNKPVVRYQLTVDTGMVDGKRKQLRRRHRTEKEARAALAEIQGQVARGTYVQPSTLTVEQACADWLRSATRFDRQLVAAWLGHADVSFTMRTYVHAQPEALEIAARSFAPPAAHTVE